MSDLIDRQAVIDLLKQMRKDGDMVPWEGKDVFARIRKLPTIQPEKTQLSQEGTTKGATSDLISRQAAIDAIEKMNIPEDMCVFEILSHIEVEIATLPTIQPEPHEGYWIRRDCGLDVECKCSRCGYKDFVQPGDEYWFKRNYCPNCGEKMKGVRHESN